MPSTDKNIRATAATIPRIKLKNPSSKPTTKRRKAAPSLHALRKQYSHNAISIIVMIVDDVADHTIPHLLQLPSFQIQNIGKHNMQIMLPNKHRNRQARHQNHHQHRHINRNQQQHLNNSRHRHHHVQDLQYHNNGRDYYHQGAAITTMTIKYISSIMPQSHWRNS
jgi:hypothetical protein